MTILFFSDIPWFGLHQRPQHLASRFSRDHRVLWLEPATLGHRPSLTPRRITDTLHIVTLPQFPHNARNRVVRILANGLGRIPICRLVILRIQVALLRRAMRLLNIDAHSIGFFFQNFQFIDIADFFSPLLFLSFDYIDNAFGFTSFPGYVRKAWEKTIRSAHLVTVTSPALRKQIQAVEDRPVQVVSNGVEYDVFASPRNAQRPDDLPPPGKPVIGYVGAVYPWFDFDLLRSLL